MVNGKRPRSQRSRSGLCGPNYFDPLLPVPSFPDQGACVRASSSSNVSCAARGLAVFGCRS